MKFAKSVTAVLLASSLGFAQEQAPPQHEKFLEQELHRLIENSPVETRIHVDLVFRTQPDFEAMKMQLGTMPSDQWPLALKNLATDLAAPEQAAALAMLRNYEEQGLADQIVPLWLTNVIGVTTTADVILELTELEEVAYIHYDPPRNATQLSTTPTGGTPTCGVEQINAPWAWQTMNATGQGVVVAHIDSGVCYNHPDLVGNIWVNPGEDLGGDGIVWHAADRNGIDDDGNGFVDDLIGWDYFLGSGNNPLDIFGHGTHTAGTVVGDGASSTQTGVAPGAKLMPVRTSGFSSYEIEVWQCMQYAVLMDADVITLSLGWQHAWGPDRAVWRSSCENAQATGVIMIVAAGNEGSASNFDNVRTPGDVPGVTTVGATDCLDGTTYFTSIGPTEWANVAGYNDFPYPPGLIKPDVSAPGLDIVSTDLLNCSGYTLLSGSSMSTPHVAGAVAILRSLRPDLSVQQVKQALMETSLDLGPLGKDNTYGAGRMDVAEMVRTNAPLRSSAYEVSAAAGATLNLVLEGTAARAGQDYWVLASVSGNEPGTALGGGPVLPLNMDGVFALSIADANGPIFQNTKGVLDVAGNATASIAIAPGSLPPAAIGQVLSLAYATLVGGTVTYTSNPVNISILP